MNIWEILGIPQTNDARTIKRAYAKLLAKYHPEEHPKRFEEIQQAYEIAQFYVTTGMQYDAVLPCDVPESTFENAEPISFEMFLHELPEQEHGDHSIFSEELSTLEEEFLEKEKEWVKLAIFEFNRVLRYDFNVPELEEYLLSEAFEKAKRSPHFTEELLVILQRGEDDSLHHSVLMKMMLEAFAFERLFPQERHLHEAFEAWLRQAARRPGQRKLAHRLSVFFVFCIFAGLCVLLISTLAPTPTSNPIPIEIRNAMLQSIFERDEESDVPDVDTMWRIMLGDSICRAARAYLLEHTGEEWATNDRIFPTLDAGYVFTREITYYAIDNPEQKVRVLVQYSTGEMGRIVDIQRIEILP